MENTIMASKNGNETQVPVSTNSARDAKQDADYIQSELAALAALPTESLTLFQRMLRAKNPTDKPLTVKVTLYDADTGEYTTATVPAHKLRETTADALYTLVHKAPIVIGSIPVGGEYIAENGKSKRDRFARPMRGDIVSGSLAQATNPAL
jgi:hypothetical protein